MKVLAVRVGREIHAIPIDAVEEVLPSLPIEPVAQTPAGVLGVVYVRGHLIPVLDAAEQLALKRDSETDDPHIVCLREGSKLVGVLVDEALDLMDLDEEGQQLSSAELGSDHGAVESLYEHQGEVIRLLNTERLIAPGRAVPLENARAVTNAS